MKFRSTSRKQEVSVKVKTNLIFIKIFNAPKILRKRLKIHAFKIKKNYKRRILLASGLISQ